MLKMDLGGGPELVQRFEEREYLKVNPKGQSDVRKTRACSERRMEMLMTLGPFS